MLNLPSDNPIVPCFSSLLHQPNKKPLADRNHVDETSLARWVGDGGATLVSSLLRSGNGDTTPNTKSIQAIGILYIAVLFFKERAVATTTPRPFLDYLHERHLEVLDSTWQADRVTERESVYGQGRVLVGQPGFASLAAPHLVPPSDQCGALNPLTTHKRMRRPK
ncbi:MAG: hypothetical protein IH991_12520 [Planctomycetes bacterium]|nr:hypothetical protein [Planctomycetota bacterium]